MNFIFKITARLYSAWMHRLEGTIGYRLTFGYIPESWINSWMVFDMTRAWAKHNIDAIGVNYFTIGSLVGGLSSRFIRSEKQYQSWLGAYLVKFKENKDFTLQDHFNLAVADQKNWLKSFGDPKPFIEMSSENAVKVESFTIGSFNGTLYEFLGGHSHSDIGIKSSNWRTRITMPIMAAMMNLINPKLKLRGSNFLPRDLWVNYETVTLKGYVAIIELEKNTKFVLYGNGTAILINGRDTDYYPLLKGDILKAFKSVEIKKLI